MRSAQSQSASMLDWTIVSTAILSIRFVQGWIYWGGGSRRFIYAPQKLDPYSSQWLANKMQAAMPGSILGTEHFLNYLLQHFYLLYPAIIIFSLVELIAGIGLIFGFMTRFFAFVTVLLSITLMLLFGWEGATCMDEWTMAASNFAMGATLLLSGSTIYSIDGLLLKRNPYLLKNKLFVTVASGPWRLGSFNTIANICILITILFTLTSYNYYRGAIYTRYHEGPVSPTKHHIALSEGALSQNGTIVFTAYVDSGTTGEPSNIVRVELDDAKSQLIYAWDGERLSRIIPGQIKNVYAYNQFAPTKYGLAGGVGAKASVTLTAENPSIQLRPGFYQLHVYTINGSKFDLSLELK